MDQNDRPPTVLIVEDFEDSAPTVAGDGGWTGLVTLGCHPKAPMATSANDPRAHSAPTWAVSRPMYPRRACPPVGQTAPGSRKKSG